MNMGLTKAYFVVIDPESFKSGDKWKFIVIADIIVVQNKNNQFRKFCNIRNGARELILGKLSSIQEKKSLNEQQSNVLRKCSNVVKKWTYVNPQFDKVISFTVGYWWPIHSGISEYVSPTIDTLSSFNSFSYFTTVFSSTGVCNKGCFMLESFSSIFYQQVRFSTNSINHSMISAITLRNQKKWSTRAKISDLRDFSNAKIPCFMSPWIHTKRDCFFQ